MESRSTGHGRNRHLRPHARPDSHRGVAIDGLAGSAVPARTTGVRLPHRRRRRREDEQMKSHERVDVIIALIDECLDDYERSRTTYRAPSRDDVVRLPNAA